MAMFQGVVAPLQKRLGDGATPVAIAGLACIAAILVLTLIFRNSDPASSGYRIGVLVLDRWSSIFPYPFTIQNLEHLMFETSVS